MIHFLRFLVEKNVQKNSICLLVVCNNIQVFTVNFGQFNAILQNKSINNFLKKKKKSYWPEFEQLCTCT